jgi:hypothetical protein
VLRKVSAVFFGAGWAVLAYFLWPDMNLDSPLGDLTVGDVLMVGASIVAVVVGLVACVLTWRA